MDQDLVTLADIPALASGDGKVTARIPVARLGKFKDRRYGNFAITREDYDGWKRNLTEVFNGEAPVDYDHSPEKGGGSEAAGWIKSLELDGDKVMAQVDFTPQGAQAIRDGRWRYISPTFRSNYRDEHGEDRGRTLIGAGLTNRPFLKRGMPAISLSADDFQEPAESVAADASDSRDTMPDLTKIAEKLSLDADADEAKILDAIDTLQAAGEGVKTLSADDYATLLSDAEAGRAAVATLEGDKFTTAWTKALDEGRVAPASKENFEGLRDLDVDLAVKTLNDLPQIVKTTAAGDPARPGATAPAGVDADRFELHEQAEAIVKAKGIAPTDRQYGDAYRDAVHTLEDQAQEA